MDESLCSIKSPDMNEESTPPMDDSTISPSDKIKKFPQFSL